jgi:hypothetical protein
MVKGKTMTPVPEGIISTSTGPAEAIQEVVPVVEEVVEEVEDDLPELS